MDLFSINKIVSLGILSIVLFLSPATANSQTQAISLKASYSDFQFYDVAKSYVTNGGDFVQMVRDRFTGTGGIGAEIIYFSENESWIFNVSAEYRSSNLFGSSGFQAKYSPSSNGEYPDWDQIEGIKIEDATSFFRTVIGFGFSPFPNSTFFFNVNPNLDVQYGQRVYLEDAYNAFVERGFSMPSDFRTDNSLMIGGVGRINAGIWLSDQLALVFSPGFVWTTRFDESYEGYSYRGVKSSGSSFGYEFAFNLVHRM